MQEITHSKPTIEKDDIEAVEAVLKSGMIADGRTVGRFEDEFSKYIGSRKAVAASSGRNALILALKGLGIGPGDEVILPTYVCKSVLDSVVFAGARPVIVDIDDDYCISLDAVRKGISSKTKAVIVVHIFGISSRIDEILKAASRKKKIALIEDCAQSIGGEINAHKLGSFGDLSFFSFQATKVMTCGKGGMLLVNNEELLKRFENKNMKDAKIAFTSMSDIQAALGLSQLKRLASFIRKRRMLAARYIDILKGMPSIDTPIRDMEKSIFFRFPIRIKKRFSFDLLRKRMEDQGIHLRRGVDLMLHQVKKSEGCPNADRIFKETVSLPIYPSLESADIELILEKLTEAV